MRCPHDAVPDFLSRFAETIVTAQAHALIVEMDGILAECELVKSHLAVSGAPLTVHGVHGDLTSRLEKFRDDLRRALGPTGATGDKAVDRPAMWAAKPGTEPAPVAAEAVADAPAAGVESD